MPTEVAVASGGATGIGLAVAKRLVRSGVHVVITGRRKKEGQDAALEYSAQVTFLNLPLCSQN